MKNAFAVIATVGVASVLPMQAQAATDLFLTWPGIIGPSTIQGHAGDIELTSYTQTASNTASQSSGGGGSGKAVCGAITITKGIDSTSPVFLGMVLSGRHTAGPVTVTFAKSKQDTTFYTVSLRDVIPTSITQSDDPGPGRITETIVLSASQFEFTLTPQLPMAASAPLLSSALTASQTSNCSSGAAAGTLSTEDDPGGERGVVVLPWQTQSRRFPPPWRADKIAGCERHPRRQRSGTA